MKHRNRCQLNVMERTSTTSSEQEIFQKQEDNLAMVFSGIILVFLICHMPRNLLNLLEMSFIQNAVKCLMTGQRSFPYWVLVGAYIRFVQHNCWFYFKRTIMIHFAEKVWTKFVSQFDFYPCFTKFFSFQGDPLFYSLSFSWQNFYH